ncbi:IclR family transcriptional regulator [Nocardioides sp. J9]|uniref:IclR family transcriptional regulator n=1 Tax=unclassified Nocardioides TaxID=2615069 RepID=UPI0004AF3680|nr:MULTISPECIES: IclR family transcriptional regulator [unclassified Nocardioides]TWG97789.1 IclR family transcriptional regulator [Nocardioides sp. J9]
MDTAQRPLQSLGRALGLLEQVADAGEPIGLSDLAAACGVPVSTAHRMVRSLVASGYLHQDPDRRYRLGPRLVALGGIALHPVGPALTPWLQRLERSTGETASAATLCGDVVLYVAQVQSSHPMRTSTVPHHRTMAHCSAVGKAMLAQLADDAVAELVRRTGLPRRTHRTLGTVEDLLADLATVRRLGYAVDDEEDEYAARCVAVPVLSSPFPLAVSVSGPTTRVGRERVPQVAEELKRVVR